MSQTDRLPLWYIVPFEPSKSLLLRTLPWLPRACGGQLDFSLIECYDHETAGWAIMTLREAEVNIPVESPVVLLRVFGVHHCPLLGYELEHLYRGLHLLPYPPDLPEVDNRLEDNSLRQLRVIVWTDVSVLAVSYAPSPHAHVCSRAKTR